MADDPCTDPQKALGAAKGALVLAMENDQRLPKTIDFDELSSKDAAIYSAFIPAPSLPQPAGAT